MSNAGFAEVEEQDADGETAAIYADLRQTLNLPFVNLIWRHFPTIPGALPAIWGLLKPIYGTAQLEDCARELRACAAVAGIEALPEAVWRCAGVGSDDRTEIARLIEDYNRANALNFLAMTTASLVLRGEAEGQGAAGSDRTTPPERRASATRPLPSLSALDPAVLATVQALDSLGRLGRSNAIASLYRHLAHWPAFLSVAYGSLLPFDRSGAFQAAQTSLVERGRSLAREAILPLAAPGFVLDRPGRERALAGLDQFTGLMIGRMNVMGPALRTLVG